MCSMECYRDVEIPIVDRFEAGMTKVPKVKVPGYPVRKYSRHLGFKGVGWEAAISWGIVDFFIKN